MNWLLIIAIYTSSGVSIETVPYKDKTACEIAALGAFIMDRPEGMWTNIYTKCVLGPES